MVVRIIYRPSHPGIMAPRGSASGWASGFGGSGGFGQGTASDQPEPASKPPARSYSGVLRSIALFLFRLGLVALAMAVWRIADDLGLPLPFVFFSGMLCHWQVWFGMAVVLLGCAGLVARRLEFGRARDERKAGRAQAA